MCTDPTTVVGTDCSATPHALDSRWKRDIAVLESPRFGT